MSLSEYRGSRAPGRVCRHVLLALVACIVALSAGCASTKPGGANPDDPLEGMNRKVFGFNDFVDRNALGPVARGYKKVTPASMRRSVSNFFYNVDFPERFVSCVGQAEGGKAANETARFVVNSTVGLAGFFDPATRIGLGKYDEDLGQMMGRWGIPGTPYWVVPLLGPSNPRDTFAYAAEVFFSPFFWLDVWKTDFVSLGVGSYRVLHERAQADDEIATARASALDFYVFVRDAYTARREAQVWDQKETKSGEAPGDDLYDLPDDSEAEGATQVDENTP